MEDFNTDKSKSLIRQKLTEGPLQIVFIKKDGSQRTMSFMKVADLPRTMLEGMVKGTGKVRTLPDGSEMVYDLESKEFRIFNHKTLVGEILETDLDESVLSE